MKEFSHYLGKEDVKRQGKDPNLSAATMNEGEERLQFAKGLAGKAKPKYVLENAYEAMREAADALLYLHGYKSYSHEASIAYLSGKGFSESELSEFDRLRRIRNSIKYYGKGCEQEDAVSALHVAGIVIEKIKKMLSKQ